MHTRCVPRRWPRRARARISAAPPIRSAAPGCWPGRAACSADNAPRWHRIVPAPEISASTRLPSPSTCSPRTPSQQPAALLRQIHRAAALALAPMDGPGLLAGELPAFGAERTGVARLIGINSAPTLPSAHERNFAVLADPALAGFRSDAGRAVLAEHGMTITGHVAVDLDR